MTEQALTAAETKLCPECAEEIKAAALVCRFCGHRFDIPAEQQKPGADEGSENLAFAGYILALLMPLIGLVIGLILLSRGRSKAGWQITAIASVLLVLIMIGISQGA